MPNRWTRLTGILALIAYTIYLSYVLVNLNTQAPLLAGLYAAFNVAACFVFFLAVINTWTAKVPTPAVLKLSDSMPRVAVIIPTWAEPVWMVKNTLVSVLTQNYPVNRLLVIVSDDAHNPEIHSMIDQMRSSYPEAKLIYHQPPQKNDPTRKGESKAGNLNSALEIAMSAQDVEFIETRDADDLVANPDFLLHTLGQLLRNPKLAYVQTTKTVTHSKGDPYSNQEEFFYRSVMLYKNGANSVFPCGSGLVWRKAALTSIGGFPSWNLVEDYQSGAEALRKGWQSLYIPLVGAHGQSAPEDIPNVYKQRGTWAMDAIRFLLFAPKSGLSLRQRMQFSDAALMYIFSAITYLYAFVLSLFLVLGIDPVIADPIEINIYHITWLASISLFIISQASTGSINKRRLLKSLRFMFSMGPVYLWALIKAVAYGPNNKPRYVVTRKNHLHGLYILHVLPQLVVISCLLIGAYMAITDPNLLTSAIGLGNLVWAIVFVYIYSLLIINALSSFRLSITLRINRMFATRKQYAKG